MLERVTDPSQYLRIIRHPEVEPFVTLGAVVSDEALAALVVDPANVLLLTPEGGFLYVRQSPEIYEVHTAFTPEGRGSHVFHLARQSLAYIFRYTEALAVKTFVAHTNRAAARLATGVGFVPLRDAAALGTPGVEYLLTVKQWVKGLSVCQ